jgi:hypothetical protein
MTILRLHQQNIGIQSEKGSFQWYILSYCFCTPSSKRELSMQEIGQLWNTHIIDVTQMSENCENTTHFIHYQIKYDGLAHCINTNICIRKKLVLAGKDWSNKLAHKKVQKIAHCAVLGFDRGLSKTQNANSTNTNRSISPSSSSNNFFLKKKSSNTYHHQPV